MRSGLSREIYTYRSHNGPQDKFLYALTRPNGPIGVKSRATCCPARVRAREDLSSLHLRMCLFSNQGAAFCVIMWYIYLGGDFRRSGNSCPSRSSCKSRTRGSSTFAHHKEMHVALVVTLWFHNVHACCHQGAKLNARTKGLFSVNKQV